jgi:uncharacterized membrane protein
MGTNYNHIAGHSIDRLAGLSDGLFAVAMTLLVLDLHAPAAEAVHSEADLWRALLALSPRLLIYFMSFLTLGIFWVGQQTQLSHLGQSDRNLAWIHLAFLLAVSLMPFSTALMAEFIEYRAALLVYWANILLLGVLLYASWRYARSAGLPNPDLPPEIDRWIAWRIIIAQGLYAFGALLSFYSTYWSIGFIIVVQLNYAIAPRLPFLKRL